MKRRRRLRKDAQPPLGLQGEPAGGDVGDAAVLESEAGVADVLDVADDADAGGVDLRDPALGQAQDDVDVVDHHVQDDADVDAAEGQGADARDLHEPRPDVQPGHGADGGVEPLDVPDLHGHPGPPGQRRRSAAASATSLASGFSIRQATPRVRHASAASAWNLVGTAIVTAFTSASSSSRLCKGLAAVFLGRRLGGLGVGVVDADQLDPRHLRVNAGVQPAHPAAADHADGDDR